MSPRSLLAARSDCRAAPRDAAEHRARHQSGAARVVEIEQPAHHLARAVEAGDLVEVHVEHLAGFTVDAQPPESEGDSAGGRVGIEWGRIERLRPVRLGRLDADGALAVLYGVVERHVFAYR